MGVDSLIKRYIYSSCSRKLLHDEYSCRYVLGLIALTDDVLYDIKQRILDESGEKIPISKIHTAAEKCMEQTRQPYSICEAVNDEITNADTIVGEVIAATCPGSIDRFVIIKYSSCKWLVLESNIKVIQQGMYLTVMSEKPLVSWLNEYKLMFVLPSEYHLMLDNILLPQLYLFKVKDSLAPLFETLMDLHVSRRLCQSWEIVLGKAQELGVGTYVLRKLMDLTVALG